MDMVLPRAIVTPMIDVRPITPAERRQIEDAQWATNDGDVREKYQGQFVVPFGRKIVAHGYEVETVLNQAALATGLSLDELPLCSIDDPLQDLAP